MKKVTIFFLLATLLFLYTKVNTINAQNTQQGLDALEAQSGSSSGIVIPQTGLPNPTGGIRTILVNALNWLLGILGVISIIAFIVSGIMYLLSAGSDEAIKRAKKGMTASIIGVAVGLSGYIAVKAIDTLLRAQNNI